MMVVFFGPDGTGKTTLSRITEAYLVKKGYRVSHIRLRSHHLAMYLLVSVMKKLKLIPSASSPRLLTYSLRRYFKHSRIFTSLELINVVIWVFVNVKILGKMFFRNNIIVAERYIPDFITDMLLISPRTGLLHFLARLMAPLMGNTIKIGLYANISDILSRKIDEELSYCYADALIRLYSLVSIFLGVDLYINTSKYNREKSFALIKNLLEKRLHKNLEHT